MRFPGAHAASHVQVKPPDLVETLRILATYAQRQCLQIPPRLNVVAAEARILELWGYGRHLHDRLLAALAGGLLRLPALDLLLLGPPLVSASRAVTPAILLPLAPETHGLVLAMSLASRLLLAHNAHDPLDLGQRYLLRAFFHQ